MSDIRLLISAALNHGKTIADLNASIKAIEKSPSLQKLKLKIDIDNKFTQSINQFISAANKLKTILDDQNKVISETQDVFKKLDGTVTTVSQKVLKNGEIISKTKNIHDDNRKAMKDETLAAQKLAEAVDRQNKVDLDSITILKNKSNAITGFRVTSSKGYTATSTRLESDGQTVIGSSSTTNYKKEREDEIKLQEKLNKEVEALDRAHFMAIRDNNKRIEDLDKVHFLALQKNAQRELDFRQSVEKRSAEIRDLQRRFGSDSQVSTQLNDLNAKIKSESFTSAGDYKSKLREVDTQLKNIVASSSSAASHILNFGEALRTSFVKFPVWLISGTIFVNLTRFFTQGIAYANDFNSALTQISIVTGKNQQEVASLGQEYVKLGISMGVTSKEIAQASVEFYRQGLSQTEVMKNVRVATEYAKISNLAFVDSAEILTATVNSMNVPIEHAADVYSKLGDLTATGADEIGQAFQKVGGTAGALSVSFEKVSSWIAVLSSRTRESAETIGQSIKSVLARIQTLKESGIDEEDGTKVNDVAKSLASVGISLLDNQGQFRNFANVMDELGKKWDTLDSRQKAYLSTTIAGNFQSSRFLNLMEGYKDTLPLYQAALDSAGTSQAKYNLYMQGTASHLDTLKAKFEGLWGNTFNSDGLRTVIDALGGLVDIVNMAVKQFGFLPTATLAVATAITILSTTARGFVASSGTQMLSWLGVSQLQMTKLSLGINKLAYSMGLGATSARVFTLSLIGITRAFLPLAAITLAALAIQKFTSAMAQAHDASIKATELNYDNVDSLKKQKDELGSLTAEYSSLKTAQASGTANEEQKKRLLEIQTELVDKYKVSATGIDAEGKAYTDSVVAIDARNAALQRQIDLENEQNTTKLRAKDTKSTKEYQKELSDTQDYIKKKTELQQKLAEVQDKIENGDFKSLTRRDLRSQYGIYNNDHGIFNGEQVVELFNQQIAEIDQKLQESSENLQSVLADRINVLKASSNQYVSGLKNISDGERLYVDNLIQYIAQNGHGIDQQIADVKAAVNKLTASDFDELLAKYREAQTLFASNPTAANDSAIKQIRVQADDLVNQLAGDIPHIDEFKTSIMDLFSGTVEPIAAQTKDVTSSLDELDKSVDTLVSSFSSLAASYQSLQKGESLSLDTLLDLIDTYPQIATYLAETNDLTLDKGRLIKEVADASRLQHLAELQQLSDELKVTKDALDAKQNMYLQFYQAMSGALPLEQLNAIGNQIFTPEEKAALDAQNKQYEQLQAKIKLLSKPIEYDFKVSGGYKTDSKKSNGDKAPKDAPSIQDGTQAYINSINAESEAQAGLTEQIKKRVDELEKEGKYDEAIAKRSSLLASQRKEVDLLNKANTALHSKQKALDDSTKYDLSKMVDANGELTTSYFETSNALGSGKAQDALRTLVDKYASYTKAVNENTAAIGTNKDAQKDTQQGVKDDQQSKKDAQQAQDEKRLKETQDYMEKRNKVISSFDDQLKNSQQVQSRYAEGSAEWNAEEQKQIEILAKKKDALHEENIWIKQRLAANEKAKASEKLTADQVAYLTEKLNENSDAWYDADGAIKDATKSLDDSYKTWADNVKSVAEDALHTIEDYYKSQGEAAKDALDKQLDDYEQFIDDKKKLLSRENDTEDYNKSRSKLQTEANELQAKINVLSRDNSDEGKSKVLDLKKQLTDKLSEIDDLATDRERKLRDDNFDDLVDQKKDEIQVAKDTADKKWQADLAADKIYSGLKESILQGNVNSMAAILKDFAGKVTMYMTQAGQSIDSNIIDKFKTAQDIQTTTTSVNTVLADPVYEQEKKDWQTYLSNKQKAEQLFKSTGKWDANLSAQNEAFRKKYGFKDGSYDQLKNLNPFSADTGGMTPAFAGGKFLLAHEKELMLNKTDTANILKVVDWTRNMFNNLKTPDFSKISPAIAGAGDIHYNISAPITFTGSGSKKDADSFLDHIDNLIRRKGLN